MRFAEQVDQYKAPSLLGCRAKFGCFTLSGFDIFTTWHTITQVHIFLTLQIIR